MTQYWDADGITGTHFAEADLGGLGYSGFVYDVYYVFSPKAAWQQDPKPVAAAGGPVLYELDELDAAIRGQL